MDQFAGVHDATAADIHEVEQPPTVLFQQLLNTGLQGDAEQYGTPLQAIFPADHDEVGVVVQKRGQSGDERRDEQRGVAATEEGQFCFALEGQQALVQRCQGTLVLNGIVRAASAGGESGQELLRGGDHDDGRGDSGELTGEPGKKGLAAPSQAGLGASHPQAGPATGDQGGQPGGLRGG